MSAKELVESYQRGQISRRTFIRRLVGAGVSLAAALTYADVLRGSAPAAAHHQDDLYDFYDLYDGCDGANKVTGLGHIPGQRGGKATFELVAKLDADGPGGKLKYVDQGSGVYIKAASITSMTFESKNGGCCVTIKGTALVKFDRQPRTQGFEAIACDKGEGGADDTFQIKTPGYECGGRLGGGDIEVSTE